MAWPTGLGAKDKKKVAEEEEKVAERLGRAGELLNRVERNLEEWGHASISGFVLVPDRSGFFDLNYNLDTASYVAAVRTNNQGRAAYLQQQQTTVQVTAEAANAQPGLNVASPAPVPSAQQQANQAQIAALIQQLKVAQLTSILQQVTNASLTNASAAWLTNGAAIGTNFGAATPAPTGPTNLTAPLPALLTSNITIQGPISNGFSPLTQLATGPSGNQLSESDLLQIAASAKETERVLNFLTHPRDVPGNKQVFFALGQISVMPGWRTKNDYICEVTTHLVYAGLKEDIQQRIGSSGSTRNLNVTNDSRAAKNHRFVAFLGPTNGSEDPLTNPAPKRFYPDSVEARKALGEQGGSLSLVAAFPFVEGQILDEQNSYRNQLSLLLSLAGTYQQLGYSAEAKLLANYVKQVQKDLSTRTLMPTVIPAVEANMLTYRFDPEVAAMTDPSQANPKSGSQLLPRSIPVMILVECTKEDLERWPELAVEVETRWIPRQKRSFWNHLYSEVVYFRSADKVQDQAATLRLTGELDKIPEILKCIGESERRTERRVSGWDELHRRWNVLQTLGFGRSSFLKIPDLPPRIASISPTNLNTAFHGKLVLVGEYFGSEPDGVAVRVGGVQLRVTQVKPDRIEAVLDADQPVPAGANDVVVETKNGTCLMPLAITVVKASPALTAVGPSLVTQEYLGEFVLQGSFLGARADQVLLAIGGVPLTVREAADDSVRAAVDRPLPVGTNDVVFSNSRGSFVLTQAVVVQRVTPVLLNVAPTNVPADYAGTFVITGDHLPVVGTPVQVELGGVPLVPVEGQPGSGGSLVARLVHGRLKPGTNCDLLVTTPGGSAALKQAVCVSSIAPIVRTVGPTNLSATYPGDIVLTGDNLGYDAGDIAVFLGETKLVVGAANGTTVTAKLPPAATGGAPTNGAPQATSGPGLKAGTNDLVFSNRGGGFVLAGAAVVAKSPPEPPDSSVSLTNRPKLKAVGISPGHGYYDGRTTFVIRGTNFNPRGFTDSVQQVIVGGITTSNVQVLNNELVQFEMPALSTNLTNSPYSDANHAADVLIRSRADFDLLSAVVYFDLRAPLTPVPTAAATAPSPADQLVDKQAAVLKAYQAAQTNSVLTLGPLKLAIGETGSSNTPPATTSSTVIIQNGSNTNSVH